MNTQELTEDQVAQYYREGYIVARGLADLETIDNVVAAAPVQDRQDWSPMIFDHDNPTHDAELHQLLVDDRVVGAAEQIFEAPAHVYYGMLAVVPARGGNGLPWHQDNQYTQILFNALNVFIACCDITPDKAILWVSPRSHKLGTQPSKGADMYNGGHREAVVEPENQVRLDGLKKGDVVIFDRNTYHRSLKNETDEDRYAYAAQYMAAYSRMAETGKKDPSRMAASRLKEIFQVVPA